MLRQGATVRRRTGAKSNAGRTYRQIVVDRAGPVQSSVPCTRTAGLAGGEAVGVGNRRSR